MSFLKSHSVAGIAAIGLFLGVGVYVATPLHHMRAGVGYGPQINIASEKKQEPPFPEEAYTVMMRHLMASSLEYVKVQGMMPPLEERDSVNNPEGLPFYSVKAEFLRYNESGVPISMVFRDSNSGEVMQLAYSELFTSGAFRLMSGDNSVCAPPSEDKEAAYKKLAGDFEQGKPVDRSLVDTIMRASTPDCEYLAGQWQLNREKEEQNNMLASLENLVLRYGWLEGNYPFEKLNPSERDLSFRFYDSREVFMENNKDNPPYSILFLTPDNKLGLRIRAGAGSRLFLSERGALAFCTAGDDGAWKALTDGFEQGKPVDTETLYKIIKGKPVNEPFLCN